MNRIHHSKHLVILILFKEADRTGMLAWEQLNFCPLACETSMNQNSSSLLFKVDFYRANGQELVKNPTNLTLDEAFVLSCQP